MEIKPQVVQVEAHPYFPQTELKKLLRSTIWASCRGIRWATATKLCWRNRYSASWRRSMEDRRPDHPALHVQSGHVVIPGSKNPDHIRDNFDIFDSH